MSPKTHENYPSGLEGNRLGPYLVGARLGIGGAAAVYLGLQSDTQQDHPPNNIVALKVIHEHLALEREFVHMFLDEARVATRLNHPNVIRTHRLDQDGERLYLSMEYLHGQSLHEVFVRGTRQGARLPVDLVAWIGAQVAHALHYAHTLTDASGQSLRLIHRDVSPRNIFITYDGTVKLIDFGIAHAVGRTAKTKVGQMKGTFSYIAPERALGGACDHRADIFSLAAALFEAATGQRLFRGDDDLQTLRNVLGGKVPDPRSIRDGFPDELARILLKALSLRPKNRHESARCFAEDLEQFVTRCGLEAPQPRLALMMDTVFADDRIKKDAAIEQLRNLTQPIELPPKPHEEAAQDVSHLAVSHSGPHLVSRPRRRWTIIAAGVSAMIVSLGILVQFPRLTFIPTLDRDAVPSPLSSESIASQSLAPTTVSLDLSVIPAVVATFSLGDQSITGTVARFHVPFGSDPLTVHVSAEGYEDAHLDILPDAHRNLAIPLQSRIEPVAAKPTTSSPPLSRTPRAAKRATSQPALADLLNRRH